MHAVDAMLDDRGFHGFQLADHPGAPVPGAPAETTEAVT